MWCEETAPGAQVLFAAGSASDLIFFAYVYSVTDRGQGETSVHSVQSSLKIVCFSSTNVRTVLAMCVSPQFSLKK